MYDENISINIINAMSWKHVENIENISTEFLRLIPSVSDRAKTMGTNLKIVKSLKLPYFFEVSDKNTFFNFSDRAKTMEN